MRTPEWLTLEEVLELHDSVLELHGGSRGVRDHNVLHSALQNPQDVAYYEPGSDLADLAAAYLVSLATGHAFTDGNKRTALTAMLVFLHLNGHPLRLGGDPLYRLVLDAATGALDRAAVAAFIRPHLTP
ncbi:death-on-curing protein [Deinobacterium chartae]|uniref:Death-on-curing protein n=1 Tax=Deinobacterium chartae TaxID=521158 RepID=A0A841I4P9_9DEIO|nr:type II toxin-antitoxin system death-on-curing family toxin [Deinobacterium chartae]MBB6100004.1 death-on-curing protein [Deinobacterium chartae]